jgi:hypothetical protein
MTKLMKLSIYRLKLLIKKQIAENVQLYLLGILAIAGVMGLIFIVTAFKSDGLKHSDQEFLLLVGMIITGGLFTCTILSQY